MKATSSHGLLSTVPAALLLIGLWTSGPLCALDDAAVPDRAVRKGRRPIPEPLIGESITDIDRTEAGELETDVTAGARRSTAQTPGFWTVAVEAEWGATRQLGLAIEADLARAFFRDSGAAGIEPGLQLGIAWALLHDLSSDVHLQVEAKARVLREAADGAELAQTGEPALPFTVGFRAAARHHFLTLRAGAGGEFGPGEIHRIPLWLNLALFAEIGSTQPLGFAGLELDTDWARREPSILAPTIVLNGSPAGLPLRLGVAVPLSSWREGPVAGILIRLIWEPD